jgi:hypothetical protein
MKLAILILTLCAAGCGLFPKPITVPGPESDALLPGAKGFLVMAQPRGGISAVELPSLRQMTVRPVSPENVADLPTIHAISGPDDSGRIVYIEDHAFVGEPKDGRHLLKTIRIDGTGDVTLFTRPGSALWATTVIGHGEIGSALALAPSGGRVAFLSGIKSIQMPSGLLNEGSIEIWSIDQGTGTRTDISALDEGLSWLPDGRRLAYVKLIDPKAVPNPIDPADPLAKSFTDRSWSRIPAVFIRDVEGQTEEFLHTGWRPTVSIDGTRVLLSDAVGTFYCVQSATRKAYALTGPGKDAPIAMLDDRTLLAWCFPTSGTKVKFKGAWPVNGPAEVFAIKLTRTDSEAFQTVVPYDESTGVSFGLGTQGPRR